MQITRRFKWNSNFLDKFSKNFKTAKYLKVCPVGAEFFHANRQTEMTKHIVAFCSFTKASYNVESVSEILTSTDTIYTLMNTYVHIPFHIEGHYFIWPISVVTFCHHSATNVDCRLSGLVKIIIGPTASDDRNWSDERIPIHFLYASSYKLDVKYHKCNDIGCSRDGNWAQEISTKR
jgi:hypothetical protein